MILGNALLAKASPRFETPPGVLRLTERFWCIEGEGLTSGLPTLLLRLAGCNLRCLWCDTKFASWYDSDYELVDIPTLLKEIDALPPGVWISYTGGEPLFRSEAELRSLTELILQVGEQGWNQKLETSGTIDPPDWFPSTSLYWSLAPKLPGMGTGTFLDTDLLQHILAQHAHPSRAHIKFVIGSRGEDGTCDADFANIRLLAEQVPHLRRYPIIYQPEGLTESTPEYIQRCVLLVDYLKEHPDLQRLFVNWRIMPQVHAMLFRQTRGR